MSKHPQLTRTELLSGSRAGIYKVDEPLTAYKQIKCTCASLPDDPGRISELEFPSGDCYNSKTIVKLEIPKGSTVVRPHENSNRVSDQLRTDRVIVKEIKYRPLFIDVMERDPTCVCYFKHDPTFHYNIGEEHHPRTPLDTNLNEKCTSGIHFYLDERKARRYK